jgi:hypothetical protein
VDPAAGAWLPNEVGDGFGEPLGQVVDDWGYRIAYRRSCLRVCPAGCNVVLVANERVQRVSLLRRADDGEPSRIATTRG